MIKKAICIFCKLQIRISQLGEVIQIMKRTENALDSKQVLTVIEKYSEALELLDSYDH